MDIKSLALPPQTEEQKKKEREETAGLIQSFSKNAGFTELARTTKEDTEQEERSRRFNESRQSLQATQERIAQQQQNHKQMLIDVQVEAMRIIEAEKQQVNVDTGTVSHSGTEPKLLNQNSNNLEFSGLLNNPTKKDDWFRVIDDMTRGFHTKFGKIPNLTQAWVALWENPPEGYEITTGKHLDEDCLFMSSEKPLSKKNFTERWRKYTAEQS